MNVYKLFLSLFNLIIIFTIIYPLCLFIIEYYYDYIIIIIYAFKYIFYKCYNSICWYHESFTLKYSKPET